MKFTDTPPELRKERISHINTRWEQLYELEKEFGLTALSYLFLTNSGGAAATLAFIGSIGKDAIGLGAKVALALFVCGVILSGVSRAKQFHHMSSLFSNWKRLVSEYFAGKKTWEEINREDDDRARDDFLDYAFPYASFLCFILGSGAGFYALIK
jgi:hypothetical protein